MHIAIVEDEKACTSILEQHLQRFQEETNTEIQQRGDLAWIELQRGRK